MRVHFVYVGSIDNGLPQAPYSITRNVGRCLRRHGLDVVSYDWADRLTDADVGPDDIILGHPNYPADSALRVLWHYPCRARLLIHPFHHGLPHINLPFDDLARTADAILAICGPYWYDTIEASPFAHWRPLMTRVDMAVDAAAFPQAKSVFGPPGQRVFAYIGRDDPEKGTDLLADVFSRSPYVLHYFGTVGPSSPLLALPNVVVHGWVNLQQQLPYVVSHCDFIISMGRSDANPTSLLEAAAWGFIPLAPPECGYYGDRDIPEQLYVGGLSIHDSDFTVRRLYEFNVMPEAELAALVRSNRRRVEDHYTWDRFGQTVLSVLGHWL